MLHKDVHWGLTIRDHCTIPQQVVWVETSAKIVGKREQKGICSARGLDAGLPFYP